MVRVCFVCDSVHEFEMFLGRSKFLRLQAVRPALPVGSTRLVSECARAKLFAMQQPRPTLTTNLSTRP